MFQKQKIGFWRRFRNYNEKDFGRYRRSDCGDVTGADGDVKTCAGNGLGGDGYGNAYSGPIEISGGTVKATGGNILIDRSDSYKQNPDDGAGGVYISNEVRVSEGTLIAQGGNTKDSNGRSRAL